MAPSLSGDRTNHKPAIPSSRWEPRTHWLCPLGNVATRYFSLLLRMSDVLEWDTSRNDLKNVRCTQSYEYRGFGQPRQIGIEDNVLPDL
ncbi:uncharacterized protein N7518_007157 [Penicillium psychrosexuale]|uniref:uncharacterized protein n=1 Tax=Penicillium psychrosexuale TaxID=1002107 RepID=UPI0025459592|nr:uncharacterized protein N7518_007157 [Penicillium psychrosexuale]KAJ5790146.1 hypothetical protein N7518_007157 [Penicillium psychrosexuale]